MYRRTHVHVSRALYTPYSSIQALLRVAVDTESAVACSRSCVYEYRLHYTRPRSPRVRNASRRSGVRLV